MDWCDVLLSSYAISISGSPLSKHEGHFFIQTILNTRAFVLAKYMDTFGEQCFLVESLTFDSDFKQSGMQIENEHCCSRTNVYPCRR